MMTPATNGNANTQRTGRCAEVTSPEPVTLQLPTVIGGEDVRRRWYPVIDYSRCTNCMECIDFCLFGVYGVDGADRILVEQQDNCKKGCPACSRVCPVNAIFFPEHKTPAIAGAEGGGATDFKIDLSKLFRRTFAARHGDHGARHRTRGRRARGGRCDGRNPQAAVRSTRQAAR